MPSKDSKNKKTAWEKFVEKVAERLEEHRSEFEKYSRQYTQEKDEEKKLEIRFSYLEKFVPIFVITFLDELASISQTTFEKMMSEVYEAMENKLEELGKDYLDYELMMRDPIVVFQEAFLTEKLGRKTQRELAKHEELFKDPKVLLRIMALMMIREVSLGMVFATLRSFFEVLNVARDRLEIDENWAAASFALNLEESLLKKKLADLGVAKSDMEGKYFHELLKKTINLIESKEGRRIAIDVFLSAGYRNLRNKLNHEGYLWKPTRKETNEVVRHVMRLVEALWTNVS